MYKRNKNKAEYSRINPMLLGKGYYKKRLSEMTPKVVHYAVRFAEPLTKVVLSKAKMMRLVKYIQTPPSASFYDTWNVLQHPNLYFSAIQRMMWFLDASSHLYKRVCPSVCPSVRPSHLPSVRLSVRPSVCPSVHPSVPCYFRKKSSKQ